MFHTKYAPPIPRSLFSISFVIDSYQMYQLQKKTKLEDKNKLIPLSLHLSQSMADKLTIYVKSIKQDHSSAAIIHSFFISHFSFLIIYLIIYWFYPHDNNLASFSMIFVNQFGLFFFFHIIRINCAASSASMVARLIARS